MAVSGVLSARHGQLLVFDAREWRVETPGNDSLRLQLLQSFWIQLCKRVVNIIPLRVVACSRVTRTDFLFVCSELHFLDVCCLQARVMHCVMHVLNTQACPANDAFSSFVI